MNQDELRLVALFKSSGFIKSTKIADTLQGSIWRSFQLSTNKNVVIKVTNRQLHNNHSIIVNGQSYAVQEDILKEKSILKQLSKGSKCPKSIVKYIDCLKSSQNFYLIMEDGGSSLFSFIQKVHSIIQAGNLEISHWMEVCKIIFKQMIECIEYIHSKNICHMDISLENFLINDVDVYYTRDNKLRFCTDNIHIKLCDFGLAERFRPKLTVDRSTKCVPDFLSNKYCGKPNYKSPEIAHKARSFNAKSNDIWCLGVCLFMMIIGSAPWHQTHRTDKCFMKIMNGQMVTLLTMWKRIDYIDQDQLSLIQSILKYEDKRFNMEQIKNCKWLN